MDNSAELTENKEVTPATEESAGNPDAPSFAESVKESQEAINSAEPIKKRGRKPKPRDANGNIIHEEKAAVSKDSKKAAGQAIVQTPPPPDFLKPVVNFPFQLAAMKTGWAGWNLTEEEKLSNAQFLDACMRRYLPQLQTEHAEIVGLSIGLGMAAVSRYLAYAAMVAEARASAEPNRAGDVVEVAQPQPQNRPVGMEVRGTKKKSTKDTDPAVKPSSALANFLDNATVNPQI